MKERRRRSFLFLHLFDSNRTHKMLHIQKCRLNLTQGQTVPKFCVRGFPPIYAEKIKMKRVSKTESQYNSMECSSSDGHMSSWSLDSSSVMTMKCSFLSSAPGPGAQSRSEPSPQPSSSIYSHLSTSSDLWTACRSEVCGELRVRRFGGQ